MAGVYRDRGDWTAEKARTACEFYLLGSCWRGNSCSYLHAVSQKATASTGPARWQPYTSVETTRRATSPCDSDTHGSDGRNDSPRSVASSPGSVAVELVNKAKKMNLWEDEDEDEVMVIDNDDPEAESVYYCDDESDDDDDLPLGWVRALGLLPVVDVRAAADSAANDGPYSGLAVSRYDRRKLGPNICGGEEASGKLEVAFDVEESDQVVLDISEGSDETQLDLEELTERPDARQIYFASDVKVSDAHFICLAQLYAAGPRSRLQTLSIGCSTRDERTGLSMPLSLAGLNLLLVACGPPSTALRRVELDRCPCLGTDSVIAVLERCPLLTHLAAGGTERTVGDVDRVAVYTLLRLRGSGEDSGDTEALQLHKSDRLKYAPELQLVRLTDQRPMDPFGLTRARCTLMAATGRTALQIIENGTEEGRGEDGKWEWWFGGIRCP